MNKQRLYPGAIITADPADFMSWRTHCGCGKPGTRAVALHKRSLCEGCFFRYTVMEAAGRAEEFWAAYKEEFPGDGGWVSYNVKYTVSKPDSTMRIRNIKADETIS